MFLIMGVTLYTSRVILNALGISDYGVYNVVGGVVAMMSFLNSAMSTATQRYLSFDIGREDLDQLQRTFSATLSVHYLIAILVFVFGEAIGLWYINYIMVYPIERVLAVNIVFQFSLLTLLLNIIQVPYNALLLAREHMHIYAYVSVLEASLKLLLAFSLFWFYTDKLILYSGLTFCVGLIIRSIYKYYCKRNFIESKYRFENNRKYFAELISFSGWNLFGTMSLVFKNQGVNVVLNLFFGTIINASYGIAMQVQGAVTQFVSNFQTALNPQIIQNYAADKKKRSLKLIFTGSKFSFFIMLFIVVPIIYNINFILTIWLGRVPEYTNIFIQLALISVLIDSISGPLMVGIQASGKIKFYQIIVGAVNLISLPIIYILLWLGFESYVAFIVLAVFSILSLFFRLYFLNKSFVGSFFEFIKNVLFRIIAVVICLLAMTYLLDRYLLYIDLNKLIITTILFSLQILILILSLGLDQNEKNLIKQFVKSKLKLSVNQILK